MDEGVHVTGEILIDLAAPPGDPPPLVATAIWGGPDGSVLAADPEGGDDVLVVTPSGSAERVAADGQVTAAGDLGIVPTAVARGGGVDVVVGTLVDVGDPRRGATDSGAVVARIEDGELAWCTPLLGPSGGSVTVDRTGVITFVEGVETELVLRHLDADGAALGATPLDAPIYLLMAAPDGRVVVRSDGYPLLLVIDGSTVGSLSIPDDFMELTVRHDGAIAVRSFSTLAERSRVAPPHDRSAPLRGGALAGRPVGERTAGRAREDRASTLISGGASGVTTAARVTDRWDRCSSSDLLVADGERARAGAVRAEHHDRALPLRGPTPRPSPTRGCRTNQPATCAVVGETGPGPEA